MYLHIHINIYIHIHAGKLQVSVHVGQDKPSDTLGKKSMFKRIVSASTDDKVGRLQLECII